MADIPAMFIVATKTADTNGTVFQIYVGADAPRGMLVAQFLMPNADTTSLNTNVFGGAANATRTFNPTRRPPQTRSEGPCRRSSTLCKEGDSWRFPRSKFRR
jgi:hypothetical protein